MRAIMFSLIMVAFVIISIPASAETPPTDHKPLPYLAVMDLWVDEGLPKSLGQALSDRIREVIMTTNKYTLIDRGNVEIIMAEIGRGQTGCYDESCAVEAGRMLSAHFIITGRVAKIGPDSCQFSLQMTDIARAEIVRATSERCACSGEVLIGNVENVALDVVGVQRKPGTLTVNTNPPGAQVMVDGQNIGSSPATTKLLPGKHRLIVVMQGYKLVEQEIEIIADTQMTREISLEKLEQTGIKNKDDRWQLSLQVGGAISEQGGSYIGPGMRFQGRVYKSIWVFVDGFSLPLDAGGGGDAFGDALAYVFPDGQGIDILDSGNYNDYNTDNTGGPFDDAIWAGLKSESAYMFDAGILYALPYFRRWEISFEAGIDYLSAELTGTWEGSELNYTGVPVYGDLTFEPLSEKSFQINMVGYHGAMNFSLFVSRHVILAMRLGYIVFPPSKLSNSIYAQSSTLGRIQLNIEQDFEQSGFLANFRVGYIW